MSKLQQTKEELINELNQLRKRNEELELKLKEKQLINFNDNQLKTLMESEMLYKTLFENTEDAFEIIELIYDDCDKIYDYQWLKVNKAWEKHVGLKALDVIGKRSTEIYTTDSSLWFENYDKVYKHGTSIRFETYSIATKRWFDCFCIPVWGKKVAILFRDITEKKEVQKALVESEQLYRTLFENTEDAFHIAELIYDEEGIPIDYKFVKLNENWEKHTGIDASDVLGRRVKEIFPNIEPYWIENYDKILKSGKSLHYENYNEGTKKWYGMVGIPYAKNQIAILFRDISKQKEYEKKLALQAEILTNVHDAVIVTDEHNIITYCNKAFTNLFGWEEHEVIGKSRYYFFDKIGEGSKTEFEELTFFSANFPDTFQISEMSCFCKDGKEIIVDLNISKLKGNENRYKGRIASIRDVSQRVENFNKLQQSEKKAKKLIEELRRADNNMNDFLNTFSHEIRNPMATVMLSLSLLKSVKPNSVQALKAEETLNRQLKHLSGLVDDLLDVTRIKTNKVKLNKEVLEINQLIQNAVIDYKELYNKKEVALDFVTSSSPLYIEADKVRIIQVVDNLLSNALKFTESGDSTTLIIERDEIKSEVIITIKDTGVGIEPKHQPDLFNPFMQVDNSFYRSDGGLGLGLSIVKGIVELHGGCVEVFSEGMGKGTRFTIRLPLCNEIAEKKDNISSNKKEVSKILNIIVIDDNKDLTSIMCELISFLGHRAESASNGMDGILRAKELHPDVILCDIGLPVMNGYEVAKNIRYDNDLNNVYLIALSGYVQQEDVERSRKAGFDRHLAKPISLDTLKATLEEVSSFI